MKKTVGNVTNKTSIDRITGKALLEFFLNHTKKEAGIDEITM